jgi:hypothetical protein
MANGAVVRLLELPPEHSEATTGTPGTAATEIEATIGQAMAAAVTGLGFALAEYQNGGLTNKTRTANGERVARLYELQQSTLGQIDFGLVAREQGRIALRQYLDAAGFYQRHGAEQGDAMLDMFIADVLGVVAKVTDFERRLAN